MNKLDSQGTVENYKLLMSAIIEQQVNDYKDLLIGFVKDGEKAPGGGSPLYLAQCENFFKSDWCAHLSKVVGLELTGEEIIQTLQKRTRSLYARYHTAQDENGMYYCYYYSPNHPLTINRHKLEYKARTEAAELDGMDPHFYTRLLERDRRIFGKDQLWKTMIASHEN